MSEELGLLLTTAVSLGFAHTIMGPDHYVPFVAMAHANDWSTRKSVAVTMVCGLAHVMSSVVIGMLGLLVGLLVLSLPTIEWIEASRGETAAWMLIAFGIGYLVFGLLVASGRWKHHHHHHVSLDSREQDENDSNHAPIEAHSANQAAETSTDALLASDSDHQPASDSKSGWSPWILFIVFAFGPCEALIPMLMYPAARANWMAVIAVVVAFGFATLATMTAAVLVMRLGLRSVKLPDLHQYSHALAGAAVLACGLAVKFGL